MYQSTVSPRRPWTMSARCTGLLSVVPNWSVTVTVWVPGVDSLGKTVSPASQAHSNWRYGGEPLTPGPHVAVVSDEVRYALAAYWVAIEPDPVCGTIWSGKGT